MCWRCLRVARRRWRGLPRLSSLRNGLAREYEWRGWRKAGQLAANRISQIELASGRNILELLFHTLFGCLSKHTLHIEINVGVLIYSTTQLQLRLLFPALYAVQQQHSSPALTAGVRRWLELPRTPADAAQLSSSYCTLANAADFSTRATINEG